jgi:hypothetical protein
MPIGTGAQYAPANLAADPAGYVWASLFNPDPEHIVLTPTAPLTTFNFSSAGWTGASRCTATGGSYNSLPVSVPMPSSYVVPSDNTNSGAAFLAADKRTIIQMQPIARCTAGAPGTAIVKVANVDLYGAGITGAHGGSGLSSIGGSIRVGEMRPGQQGMRHALKVNVYSTLELYHCLTRSDCYRWPATKADSYWSTYGTKSGPNNNNSAMKMGALLAIPLNVNLSALSLETEPGKQMAWTLQHFGAYIVDSFLSPDFGFSVEDGPGGSLAKQFQQDWGYSLAVRYNANTPWSRDLAKLRTALRVVNNNSPTSIGGGGTPSVPLAPPLQ